MDTFLDSCTHTITYTALNHHIILLSIQPLTLAFPSSKCQGRSNLQCKHIGSPESQMLHFTKSGWNENIFVNWLVLVNIVPNSLTVLSLLNWWILFLNCQILSIFFDSESLCGHARPSQFHHRYLNWLVSSLKRINPDNWHSFTQTQRIYSQVVYKMPKHPLWSINLVKKSV